jgi:hypothetical protein
MKMKRNEELKIEHPIKNYKEFTTKSKIRLTIFVIL